MFDPHLTLFLYRLMSIDDLKNLRQYCGHLNSNESIAPILALPSQAAFGFNEIPGVTMFGKSIHKYSSISLTILNNGDSRAQFLRVLDWIVHGLRTATYPDRRAEPI
jgi:hypothetical protein